MMLVIISSETQPLDKVNSIKGRGNIVKSSCLRNPEITQLCYNFRIMQNPSDLMKKKKTSTDFSGLKIHHSHTRTQGYRPNNLSANQV